VNRRAFLRAALFLPALPAVLPRHESFKELDAGVRDYQRIYAEVQRQQLNLLRRRLDLSSKIVTNYLLGNL
jgi:hypothetical protein